MLQQRVATQPTQPAPVFGILQDHACAFAGTPLEEGDLRLQLDESRVDLCLQVCANTDVTWQCSTGM